MTQRPWVASYPEGISHALEEVPPRPLLSLLTSAASRFPDRPATSFFGARMTYRRLAFEVEAMAGALASLGTGKGDRVSLILPNCPQYVIAFYAAQRIGAIPAGNNPLYTDAELAQQLTDTRPKVVIVLDRLYPKLGGDAGAAVVVTKITDYMPFPLSALAPIKFKKEARHQGEPWPPVPASAPVKWWKELLASGHPAPPVPEIDPAGDISAFVYTGGTTGVSKAAMLTHHNMISNLAQTAAWFPDLEDGKEAMMCVLPFFHSYGLTVAMNLGIQKAMKLIMLPRFELHRVLKTVAKEKPTLFPGVPRIYLAINDSPDAAKFDLSSIRECISGAAPLPLAVSERFEALTGGSLVEGYGLTEASPVTHANPIAGPRKPGSIGLPLPGTDCKLVDLEDPSKLAPEGERGELAISGPQVMKGYWNQPGETEGMIRTDEEGTRWLHTGDIATMDADGYFFIVDRKKDMILVSGFNVYPTEVEQVLYRHPKIAKVAVAGIPDGRTGEAVKAYVILKEGQEATPEEIIAWCAEPGQGLAAYRRPKHVEFRTSLPETLIGKVLRRVLAEEEAKRAASSPA